MVRTYKKASVVTTRRALLQARTSASATLAALDEAISIVETDTVANLVSLTATMRAVANASDGTPAANLRALARAVLERTKIGVK